VAERRPLVAEEAHASPAADPAQVAHVAAVELNNQATDELARGELVEAVAKFERCVAAEPANAVFAGNLAEALIRLAREEHERGELDLAIEHLTRALELVPARADRAALERVLERWKRERELGADDWSEESSRFELAFDTDRSDLLHRSHEVLEHLERSYDDLVLWFGRDPLAGKGSVRVVFYDPEDFDRLTGLGDWAGGVFDGVVRISARDLSEGTAWRATLVHELVHAFLDAWCGGAVPGWLNEGLAQRLEKKGTPAPNLLGALIEHGTFPLERLTGSLAGWDDPRAIGLAYVQSLAFVDYLARTYGEESLRRMLDGLARGEGAEPAFAAFTRVELALAFEDWRAGLGR
jgi:tetratricopeptide (TPR) repeat protein